MNSIIPAILAKDSKELKNKLRELPKETEYVHIDILEEDMWADINTDFEAHIMSPLTVSKAELWTDRGAKRVIVHKLEPETLELRSKVEIGLAIEINIPLEEVYPVVNKVDFLHLMSINEIGAQGNPFDERIFGRIKEIKEKYPSVVISVDGGIDINNYRKLLDTGAERLIVGSGFKELWQSLATKE